MSLILDGTNGLSDVDGSAATPAIRGSDANTGIFFPAADTIAFAEGGVEVARFDSNGSLGIGTSAPAAPLQVNGASGSVALIVGNTGESTRLEVTATSNVGATLDITDGGTNRNMIFSISGTERARIDSSGNLLVGRTTQGLSAQFEVQGAVGGFSTCRFPFIGASTGTAMVVDSNGFFRANTSSRRYKENIAPIDVGLDMVMQMQPVKYDLKAAGEAQVGFIAEDFPEQRLVNHALIDPLDPEKGEQVESVNYSNLTAILVKAIQEQQAIITALTARVEALEGAQA